MTILINPTVTLGINSIDELSIENASPFTLLKNNSGSYDEKISSYAITTNGEAKRIIGSIDGILPEGVKLSVFLEAPTGASSLGYVILSQESATLVSNISRVAQNNLRITYKLTSSKPIVAGSYPKTIRLTLSD